MNLKFTKTKNFSNLIANDIVGIQPMTTFSIKPDKKSWKVKCIGNDWVVEETTIPSIFTLLRQPVKYMFFKTEKEANEFAMLKILEQ